MDIFLKRGRNQTIPDQWTAQILLRILMNSSVIYVSQVSDEIIENMHMIPAHSIKEALEKAKEIVGKDKVTITAIPDGVSVVVQK